LQASAKGLSPAIKSALPSCGSFAALAGHRRLPLCAVATAVWKDEAHVTENRKAYAEKFEIADRVLGNRFGYQKPAGGFFLWLNTKSEWGLSGEDAALRLFEETGLRTLPGAYLSRDTNEGNPGADYIRAPLIHDNKTIENMLDRLTSLTA